MSPTIRYVVAAVVGTMLAYLVVSLIEAANLVLFSAPAGLDLSDQEALGAWIATLPVTAFVVVLAAWVVGTFVGAVAAVFMGRDRRMQLAAIVGGMMLMASISNMLSIPSPPWFWAAAIVGIPLAAWLAARLAPSRAPVEGAVPEA